MRPFTQIYGPEETISRGGCRLHQDKISVRPVSKFQQSVCSHNGFFGMCILLNHLWRVMPLYVTTSDLLTTLIKYIIPLDKSDGQKCVTLNI